MPKAVANQAQHRVDLKTCPPDGFVLIRPMDYGEELRYESLRMSGRVEGNAADLKDEAKAMENFRMEMRQDAAMAYAFNVCVIDHNLEDHLGRLLDFKNPRDVFKLDPSIADEIATAIRVVGSEAAQAGIPGGDDLGESS